MAGVEALCLTAEADAAECSNLVISAGWSDHLGASLRYDPSYPAAMVFGDPLSRTISDPLHSEEEDRFVILGNSHRPGLLVVVFTERGSNIRIISARRASRRERKDYEESIE